VALSVLFMFALTTARWARLMDTVGEATWARSLRPQSTPMTF
jgi:hypothetical protein